MTVDWPALGQEQRPWDSPWSTSTGLAEALDVAVVPPIADLPRATRRGGPGARTPHATPSGSSMRGRAVDLTALAGALLRSESVASSKIENLAASQRELGLAMLRGVPVQTAAAHVAANVRAMTAAVATPATNTPYHVADLLHLHRLLMEADPYEGGWAGRLRTMQNWVGGGDLSPHGALYVPPAPERVPGLVDRPGGVLQPHRPRPDRPGRRRARPVRDDPPVHRRQRPHRPGTGACACCAGAS